MGRERPIRRLDWCRLLAPRSRPAGLSLLWSFLSGPCLRRSDPLRPVKRRKNGPENGVRVLGTCAEPVATMGSRALSGRLLSLIWSFSRAPASNGAAHSDR